MKKKIILIVGALLFAAPLIGIAVGVIDTALVNRLKGRIVLQVQQHGEAWYLDPVSGKRYYMKDGNAAYQIMRKFGLGITDTDLAKIPVGTLDVIPSGWQTYTNETYKYSIAIPKEWSADGIGVAQADKNAAEVSWSAAGRFAPSYIDDANLTISIASCASIQKCVDTFNISEALVKRDSAVQTPTSFDGFDAIDQLFSMTQIAGGSKETIKGRDVFFIKNSLLYRISLWSHIYDEVDKEAFEKMLASFQFVQ